MASKHFAAPLSLLLLVACLAGCAGGGPGLARVAPGEPKDAVMARLGRPSAVVRLADGSERLQYSLQPRGQYAWMVDLDNAGRVLRARQVLTAAEFSRVEVDKWTRADVEREFGPPASVDGVASWNGPILTYRWNDGSDMFFWVYLDGGNVVRRTQAGMEFVNAPDRD